jgi:hypothetical protein
MMVLSIWENSCGRDICNYIKGHIHDALIVDELCGRGFACAGPCHGLAQSTPTPTLLHDLLGTAISTLREHFRYSY